MASRRRRIEESVETVETVATSAASRTLSMFPDDARGGRVLPAHTEVGEDGALFYTCGKCGLRQEFAMLVRANSTCLGCARDCSREVVEVAESGEYDPKLNRNSGGLIHDCALADRRAEKDCAVCKGDCPDKDKKFCAKCGARLTETSAGVFYPCGHDPRPASANVSDPTSVARRRRVEPTAQSTAPEPAWAADANGDYAVKCVCGMRVTATGAYASREYARLGAVSCPGCARAFPPHAAAAAQMARAAVDSMPPVVTTPAKEPVEKVGVQHERSAETVTVTKGKELFSPKQFHTYEVGPFSATTTIRAGETRVQAGERALAELEQLADSARKRALDSFMRAMCEMVAAVKGP